MSKLENMCKPKEKVKFSLLIGTLNRADILEQCLERLRLQNYKDFEIIVVDQSDNDATEKVVELFSDLNIKYSRVSFRGLSKARNIAISQMTGDYFCLIDDDAAYDKNFLKIASEILDCYPETILSGYINNLYTGKGLVDYSKLSDLNVLNKRSVLRLCPSAGLVIPSTSVSKVGLFDERFGVGAKYGSAEETDYLYRCINKHYRIRYCSSLIIDHPIRSDLARKTDDISPEKISSYAMGNGAFYRKHLSRNLDIELLFIAIETFARITIKMLLLKSTNNAARYSGFIKGWKEYAREGDI